MRIAMLYVALALLVVAAIWAVVLYLVSDLNDPNDELFKSLLQLVVVGLSSLFLSDLVSIATARESARKEANEIIRAALTNLNKVYNDIKEIRRSTRAQSVHTGAGDTKIDAKSYDGLLGRVNETQLSLELISKYLEEVRFRVGESGVLELLAQMEDYLGDMIREWEQTMPLLRGEHKSDVGFEDIPKFSDLRMSYERSEFRTHFHDPYRKAFAILVGKLVRP